jgi:hypothetical protein
MVVWGGYDPPNFFNTGGRYNPFTDSWTAVDTTNVPNARFDHTAVWDEREMIVWGGFEDDGLPTPTPGAVSQTRSSVLISQPVPVATGGRYCAQSLGTPTPTPTPAITVSLPSDTLDNSVPIATVFSEPVVTTNIDASLEYIGFEGDFTFDETVVTFSDPFVEQAGLTASGWTVAGNILPGPGPIRTLRVSAFVNNGTTALSGSGVLYNLRMLRVSSTPATTSALTRVSMSLGRLKPMASLR